MRESGLGMTSSDGRSLVAVGVKPDARGQLNSVENDPGCVKTQKIENATRMTFFSSISKSNVFSNWMPETVFDE
jgi:hypothetical protein